MCLTAKDNITDIPLQIIGKIKFEEKTAFFYSILKPNIVVEVIICPDSEFWYRYFVWIKTRFPLRDGSGSFYFSVFGPGSSQYQLKLNLNYMNMSSWKIAVCLYLLGYMVRLNSDKKWIQNYCYLIYHSFILYHKDRRWFVMLEGKYITHI